MKKNNITPAYNFKKNDMVVYNGLYIAKVIKTDPDKLLLNIAVYHRALVITKTTVSASLCDRFDDYQ